MKRKTFLSKATAMMVAVLLVFGVSGSIRSGILGGATGTTGERRKL